MKQDVITRIEVEYIPDGQGGFTEVEREAGSFDVKLSQGSNVEEATAYGVSIEEILKVISPVALLEDDSALHILVGPQGPAGPKGESGAADPELEQKIEDALAKMEEFNGAALQETTEELKQKDTIIESDIKDLQNQDLELSQQLKECLTWNDLPEIPAKLPNPEALTINGTSYDGSKAVELSIAGGGGSGENGATFLPHVDSKGNISWTNDKGLENPLEQNIMGPQGEPGPQGLQGPAGKDGADGKEGPQGLSGKDGKQGPQGLQGEPGPAGANGVDGKDGYTPKKGVDYWTAADVKSMIQEVLNKLPAAEEVKF